ncbi:MAG: hypothetical protein ABIU63_03595 [Chitinophagaceae bacterium]
MDNQSIFRRLQQITGQLGDRGPSTGTAIKLLNRKLAEQFISNPDTIVSGTQLQHEAVTTDTTIDLQEHYHYLSDLLEKKPVAAPAEAPLIFRRETSFRNNLLGSSVPAWGSGLAPSVSYGPFLDDHGLQVWFDFFYPTRTIKVFIQGQPQPVLLIPVWGSLTARSSFKIEAGSVWIASQLIARTNELNGYYTGLKIAGGTLQLNASAAISNGTIVLPASSTAELAITLHQNKVTGPSADAGFDATAATVSLPPSMSLQFNALSSKLTAADASCTVFGNATDLRCKNTTPVWIDLLNHILVPFAASSTGENADTFVVSDTASKLCSIANNARFDTNSGWLLPAARVNAAQLGDAAGTGSLCIGLKKGLACTWKGLKGGTTKLTRPAIIAEPGMLTVIDFFAENIHAKQKWVLWQNSGTAHNSDIRIGFGKAFPFFFISASKGTEQVMYFCNYKASFDKPIDANGHPLAIQSSVALAGIVQTAADFKVLLLDNDLLFDGNAANPAANKHYAIALRNALFNVSSAYSFFLTGNLRNDTEVNRGTAAMMFAIRVYLPTLPDPYVASYTAYLRDAAGLQQGLEQTALAAFVKWPYPPEVAEDATPNDPAYLYFRLAPLNLPTPPIVATNLHAADHNGLTALISKRNFQTGVTGFGQNIAAVATINKTVRPLPDANLPPVVAISLPEKKLYLPGDATVSQPEINSILDTLTSNPLLNHIQNKEEHLSTVIRAAMTNKAQAASGTVAGIFDNDQPILASAAIYKRGSGFAERFMLLDVSSNADQMGVSVGAAIRVDRGANGNVSLNRSETTFNSAGIADGQNMPLQILNMDVVVSGLNVRAVTLPQISWEPVFNIPLKIEGPLTPTAIAEIKKDLITYTPGLVVYENDGIPTRIFSESPYQVPITPLSVTRHFIKEFNDKLEPRQLHAVFTLPFALVAQAHFNRSIHQPNKENAKLHFNMPWFGNLHGGLQIKATAPIADSPSKSNMFKGQTVQIEDNLRWFLLGYPLTGSTLGNTVKKIFNGVFNDQKPAVPLEKIELSGYGASMFSNWLNKAAAIADVSQAKFDVIMGRTGHEVIQVRSVMYMCTGIVHVVRTVTLMRSPSGYVFRSDSGWKAESDAFYDCDYNIEFGTDTKHISNPYEFHPGPVKGVSNVREIKDYPAGGTFNASFSLDEGGLSGIGKTLAEWQQYVFKNLGSFGEQLPVELKAVVFDADVHMDNVTSGGIPDGMGGFKVQSRKRLGYVQLSPTGVLIPPKIYAALLNFQNGSLGGPVDATLNIAGSGQKMRIARVDISSALNGAGKPVFVSAARGSLILPKDGSWSTVKQHTDTGDVKPIEEGQLVPLIKTNGAVNFKIAQPADILNTTASKINFGVLQSTGTQKLLFDVPQFASGVKKLLSAQTYFADAYKLLNSKGVFPNIANALQLTNAEKEVQILGEGLMKMAERTLDMNNLLSNFQYPFIDEPGILKIYAEYKSKNGTGNLKLGIDSAGAAADKWKAALSNIRVVVDLGPFTEIMWVNGNFDAGSSVKPSYKKPNLEFGPVLQKVKDILQVLQTLSGGDYDKGMDIGMSNAPDNWEYKFSCSQEIPVVKFPSPFQLSVNPNPPLKLEAGLKVGFYFNEVIAIPTDVKQLVPACGAFVEFYGRIQVMCFSLAAASIYAVGQATLGVSADTKAGFSVYMKLGFGVELVVGLPVVGNVTVLYMVEVIVGIGEDKIRVGAMMLFRGSAEICGGLVGICIQIEAGGAIEHSGGVTSCIAQVTFSIDVCVLWVIDINFSETWEESRQIA